MWTASFFNSAAHTVISSRARVLEKAYGDHLLRLQVLAGCEKADASEERDIPLALQGRPWAGRTALAIED